MTFQLAQEDARRRIVLVTVLCCQPRGGRSAFWKNCATQVARGLESNGMLVEGLHRFPFLTPEILEQQADLDRRIDALGSNYSEVQQLDPTVLPKLLNMPSRELVSTVCRRMNHGMPEVQVQLIELHRLNASIKRQRIALYNEQARELLTELPANVRRCFLRQAGSRVRRDPHIGQLFVDLYPQADDDESGPDQRQSLFQRFLGLEVPEPALLPSSDPFADILDELERLDSDALSRNRLPQYSGLQSPAFPLNQTQTEIF